jgi:hypothetical protein
MCTGIGPVNRRIPYNHRVTAPRVRSRLLESIGAVLVVAAALQYWLWYFRRATNLLDEGSTAAQALRIVKGELIYRDFFTVVTPGSYYTIAWLFQMFGERLMVLRWAALGTGLLIVVVTLLVARRVMSWPFAAAAALMTTVWGWFLVTPNFYSLQAALLALIALWCYLRHVDGGGTRWIVLAGVLTGLTVLVKQNVGAYVAVALFATIWMSRVFDRDTRWNDRLRTTVRFISGICMPVLPALLILILAGAGPYLYESWVYYPLVKYPERFALPYPAFFEPLPEHGIFERWVRYVIFLPVIVYPLIVIALVRGRQRHALLAIAFMGLLLLLQSWPRADVAHILFGMQPTFILFAYLLYLGSVAVVGEPPPKGGGYVGSPVGGDVARAFKRGITTAVMLVPIVLLLWNGYRRTDWEYANYVAHLQAERGGSVTTVPLDANRINAVVRYINEHTAPDDPIFVVPWAAGFYFLTDRGNPTRTDFMLFEDPELYPCLLSRLDAHPPKYVIYGYTWDVDGKRFSDYAAPVDRYIRSRYAIESSVDGYEIWRRIEGIDRTPEAWPNACQPRRFRWRDLLRGPAESASTAASSVQ